MSVTSLEPTLNTAMVWAGGDSDEVIDDAALLRPLGLALAAGTADAAGLVEAAGEPEAGFGAADEAVAVAWPASVWPQADKTSGASPARRRKRRRLSITLSLGGQGCVAGPRRVEPRRQTEVEVRSQTRSASDTDSAAHGRNQVLDDASPSPLP